MSITLKKIGSSPHHELLIADAEYILIVQPEEGFKDTAEASRQTVTALREYAGKLGRKCGLVVVINNLLAQEAESRRVYSENVTPDLFFGITLVVSSPLARAIGNAAMRLNTLKVPIVLVESIEAGIAWNESKSKA